MFNRLLLCTILFLLALTVPASLFAASEYKKEYKMSVVVGPKLPWGAGATKFAELVRERTEGRINIKVYTSSSLMAGKQTNEFLITSGRCGLLLCFNHQLVNNNQAPQPLQPAIFLS